MLPPNEVLELIATSGNNFHSKVAKWFYDNDWHVIVSPYYMDQTQNKAREIDLIAEKLYPVQDIFNRYTIGHVAVRLFIECKFIPTHSVFWFADKDMPSANELVCSDGTFLDNHRDTKNHHYLTQSPKVAKLFATSINKSAEADPFYKALNQVLNAMVSMRTQPLFTPKLLKNQKPPFQILQFPVVVCSSFEKLFSVDFFDNESSPTSISKNFQLEVRYAYIDRHNTQRDDYFLLDFIDFQQLENFINAIDQDGMIAASFATE
ncbi:MAG: hypothetical protein V4525_10910 [Pseudomonadota bacterium]